MNMLVVVINAGALLAILAITVFRLNIMSHVTTRFSLRLAYVSLSVGAFAALWDTSTASWELALLHIGIAAVLLTDARKPACYAPNRECDA